ncbi:MAG TPA: sulfatase [Acidobacteriota bacterium]|nr:sulfatase [Acidobacteriota bacterium]
MRKFLLILILVAITGGAAAIYVNYKDRYPNIVLITIDTLRSDHCTPYGYKRDTTPFMSTLAQQGSLFENVYAPMPTTGPSHSTMFTSRYPLSHGVVKNGYVLPKEEVTIAEILQQNGYTTAAVVSSFALNSKFGLNQGFSFYDEEFIGKNPSMRTDRWQGIEVEGLFDRRAKETTATALKWLKSQGNKPFFLWIHYFDPHGPYDPPERYKKKFLSALNSDQEPQHTYDMYDGEIAYTDTEIQKVIKYIDDQGMDEDTLLIVTADHGEGLGQHNHMHHGLFVYEEAVRVPLVIRWPGKIPAGLRIRDRVELLDLPPTILEITGVPAKTAGYQGRSMKSLLKPDAVQRQSRPIFFQRRLYETENYKGHVVKGEKLGVLLDQWKYIEALKEQSVELYDLKNDPGELTNVSRDHPDQVKQLSLLIQEWRKKYGKGSYNQKMSEEDIEALRSLGYVQ